MEDCEIDGNKVTLDYARPKGDAGHRGGRGGGFGGGFGGRGGGGRGGRGGFGRGGGGFRGGRGGNRGRGGFGGKLSILPHHRMSVWHQRFSALDAYFRFCVVDASSVLQEEEVVDLVQSPKGRRLNSMTDFYFIFSFFSQ